MLGNAVIQLFTVNLEVGVVNANSTLVHSISTAPFSGLIAGSPVIVTPRFSDGIASGVALYGTIVDSTHFGIAFVNGTGAGIDVGTLVFDVAVVKPTGNVIVAS